MILLSWTAFSQQGTKNPTDSIVLNKDVAKKIAKDLVELDYRRSTDTLLQQNIVLLHQQLNAKDSIISIKDSQLNIYQRSIQDYLIKDSLYQKQIKLSGKTNKWLKVQRTGLGILLVSSILFFTFKG